MKRGTSWAICKPKESSASSGWASLIPPTHVKSIFTEYFYPSMYLCTRQAHSVLLGTEVHSMTQLCPLDLAPMPPSLCVSPDSTFRRHTGLRHVPTTGPLHLLLPAMLSPRHFVHFAPLSSVCVILTTCLQCPLGNPLL